MNFTGARSMEAPSASDTAGRRRTRSTMSSTDISVRNCPVRDLRASFMETRWSLTQRGLSDTSCSVVAGVRLGRERGVPPVERHDCVRSRIGGWREAGYQRKVTAGE